MTLFKHIFRTIKNNLYRYLALIFITLVGVCFVSGIGGIADKVRNTISEEMLQQKFADAILKSKKSELSSLGFSKDEQDKIKAIDDFSSTVFFTSFETTNKELSNTIDINPQVKIELKNFNISISDKDKENIIGKYYSYPFDSDINNLKLIDGRFPKNDDEVVVERSSLTVKEYNIGDIINFKFNITGNMSTPFSSETQSISFKNKITEYKVVGIVQNPLMYSKNGDEKMPETFTEGEYVSSGEFLETIMYAKESSDPLPYFTNPLDSSSVSILDKELKTDCFVKFKNTISLYPYTKEYKSKVDDNIKKLAKIDILNEDNVVFIDYSKNKSYQMLDRITEKIDIIVAIFPVLFILVVLLVTSNNLTKMISDDRSTIGCLKSLGYSNSKIIFKYIFFSFTSVFIGAVAGLLIGMYTVPDVFLPAFTSMLFFTTKSSKISYILGLASAIAILIVTQLFVFLIALKNVKEEPASLLRPKAPKPGKKIFLEKMPAIWSKLKFKTKSCFRNIFRYKGRLLMTIFSTALSTSLVLGGFGLWNVSKDGINIKSGFTIDTGDTLIYVSLIVLAFAMLLSILVLYNIINMNIDERRKEIATLKVLGYRNKEVYSYIFKDVVIMASVGITLGLPLGVLLLWFIFHSLGFGSLAEVEWYTYVASFAISFAFIFVVFLMVVKKMKNINMSDSLQSRE